MELSKSLEGFIVIWSPPAWPIGPWAPLPVTWALVTPICSTVLLSDVFLIVIFPDVALTLSLNVRTILALTATPVALSAGTEEERVGAILSSVVKLKAVVELIPA